MFRRSHRLHRFALFGSILFVSLPVSAGAQTAEIETLREQVNRPETSGDDWNELGFALLAHHLRDGMGIDEVGDHPGLVEARRAFRRGADLGDADAINNLAAMFRQGHGGPQDSDEANRLLREAAAAGSAGALGTLSNMYRDGLNGFEQDYAQAFQYMRAAAETGDPMFQWRFAMMILRGIGTEPDSEEAYRWLVIASEHGGVRAMTSRAVMLATGDGVAEDDVAARQWYRRAAESGQVGFDQALKNLGRMHFMGEGGPQNRPLGYAFIRISAAAGNSEAEELIDRIHDQLTDEELDQAFALAQEWVAEHIVSGDDAE